MLLVFALPRTCCRVLPDKECSDNPNTLLAATERGGHVAFLQGLWPLGPAFMDGAVLQFLEAAWQHLPPPARRAAPAQAAYHPPSTLHPHHAHLRQQQQQQQQQQQAGQGAWEAAQGPRVWLQPEVLPASGQQAGHGEASTSAPGSSSGEREGAEGASVGQGQEGGVRGGSGQSDEGATETLGSAGASAQAAACAAASDEPPSAAVVTAAGAELPPQPQLEREHTRALYQFPSFCRSKL